MHLWRGWRGPVSSPIVLFRNHLFCKCLAHLLKRRIPEENGVRTNRIMGCVGAGLAWRGCSLSLSFFHNLPDLIKRCVGGGSKGSIPPFPPPQAHSPNIGHMFAAGESFMQDYAILNILATPALYPKSCFENDCPVIMFASMKRLCP